MQRPGAAALAVARRVRRIALLVVAGLAAITVAVALLGGFSQPAWTECTTERTSRTVPEVQVVEPPVDVSAEQLREIPTAVNMAQHPETLDWYVAKQRGELVRLTPEGDETTVLELEVAEGNEQGLLGVAIDPEGEHLYLDHTDPDGTIIVSEYVLVDGEPDPETRRELLRLEKSRPTHNGGTLRMGPDGMLWISLGDGGGAEGPQNILGRWFQGATGPRTEEAQSTDDLWGSILRIDPQPDGDEPYSIPEDNPFVGVEGARPEIWAYGLRNPWQFSVDEETGDLWLGDVGQVCWEELNVARGADGGGAGTNFGWAHYEGQHLFEGGELEDAQLPPVELPRSEAYCSVVGGSVYRGSDIPELEGWYLFTDSCVGKLMAARELDDGTWELTDLGVEIGTPVSFATDVDGEVYVLSLGGGPFKVTPEEPGDPS